MLKYDRVVAIDQPSLGYIKCLLDKSVSFPFTLQASTLVKEATTIIYATLIVRDRLQLLDAQSLVEDTKDIDPRQLKLVGKF